LRQKLSIVFLGLLIFVAGVQTGNGSFSLGQIALPIKIYQPTLITAG
jgi:hypothetical protein